jgi:hypothetical protein
MRKRIFGEKSTHPDLVHSAQAYGEAEQAALFKSW